MSAVHYCSFRVGSLLVGVAIDRVAEVVRPYVVTPVPLAHPDIAGLLNLRGQVLTAIDARRRLGVGDVSASPASTVVIVTGDDEPVGLLVDEAGDVIDVEDRLVEPVPATVRADVRELSVGTYQLDDDLLLLVETDRMITLAT